MKAKWVLSVLAAFPLWFAARLAAPFAVMGQDKPEKLPAWAWWVGPADHDMCGPKADPMWRRWWETDEGKGRAWYCTVLKKAGIQDCAHPLVRLLQLWRNGGAGAMYKLLGVRTDNLLITREESPGKTEYLAYRMSETMGVGGGRSPIPGAKPVAWYVSIERKSGWGSQMGWKLNHPVVIQGRTYCKLSFSPWRK